LSLTFVPTPLGNLRDITLRALEVLRDCTLIVAEDTRVTRRLLSAHGLSGKRLVSYREANADAVTPMILERAQREAVAVLSDAGMPAVSDPGRELIVAARAAGIAIEVLPGPVAFIGAAVLSGFPLEGLTFGGFVPRVRGARRTAFEAALERGATSAWYESPQRIRTSLEALRDIDPTARVFVLREWTKRYEQQILGTPAEAALALAQPVRGEIVLVIGPRSPQSRARPGPDDLDAAIDRALGEGRSVAAIAKALARERAGSRAELYARVAARKRARAAREGAGDDPG
jgi:16S rRNA (cytidine1402-2'-O)-methyltransferase